jgi:hypothetical protein
MFKISDYGNKVQKFQGFNPPPPFGHPRHRGTVPAQPQYSIGVLSPAGGGARRAGVDNSSFIIHYYLFTIKSLAISAPNLP